MSGVAHRSVLRKIQAGALFGGSGSGAKRAEQRAGEAALRGAVCGAEGGPLRQVGVCVQPAIGGIKPDHIPIGKLADLASQLRGSVAGFRLPESSKGQSAPVPVVAEEKKKEGVESVEAAG